MGLVLLGEERFFSTEANSLVTTTVFASSAYHTTWEWRGGGGGINPNIDISLTLVIDVGV
jgi:hypothetical protein